MKHKLFFVSPNRQLSALQITGIALLFIGILSFIGVGLNTMAYGVPTPDMIVISGLKASQSMAVSPLKPTNQATIMGLSMLLVTLSWPLIFPDMLRSSSRGEISSTRAGVFMIVATFVLFAVRAGWTDPALQGVVLHGGWISVLGIAFGAKTLQYWAENNPFGRNQVQGPISPLASAGLSTLVTGPNAAPVTPNPGLAAVTAKAASPALPAMQLPTHFHNEISSEIPTELPPAIKKAFNS